MIHLHVSLFWMIENEDCVDYNEMGFGYKLALLLAFRVVPDVKMQIYQALYLVFCLATISLALSSLTAHVDISSLFRGRFALF